MYKAGEIALVGLFLVAHPFAAQGEEELCMFVDPFIGTSATGHTSPAACVPFGMVQAGPTTGTLSWRYCSGYQYKDCSVTGYALTALSGTGFCEYNELQVLPFSGSARGLPMNSAIDKEGERAEPGYYAVRQPDDGVSVEIAAAKRAAIYRFTWDKGREAKVLVNLPYGNGQRDGSQLAGSHDGKIARMGGCIIEGEHFRTGCIMRRKIAFALEFSHPWTKCEELPKEDSGELPRYVLSFDIPSEKSLFLKVAFSVSSSDAARRNLVTSIPDWDFDGVKAAARAAWNTVLSRSTCEGSDEQKRNWYTALYHLYFQPNDYSDADDVETRYTTLSFWDTFRAAQPWYSVVMPEVSSGVVTACLTHFKTFGRLPVMSYGGMNFDCMIGNHSVPVIVDWFIKECKAESVKCKVEGGELFTNTNSTRSTCSTRLNDPVSPVNPVKKKYWLKAYAQIKDTLTKSHPGKPKEDWNLYDKYGYYPFDEIKGESVSRTLECAYDDWCAGVMAQKLGEWGMGNRELDESLKADSEFFFKRSENWRNVFDNRLGLVRGKDSQGRWREPFDPFAFGHGAELNNDFTEGNAFQYSWHVMHDVDGLVEMMGGREAALKRLKSLFMAGDVTAGAPPDVTGLIGQYVHGNEPSHHVIYLFTLLERPDLAAERIREVFDKFYIPKPDGLCGNDDCGQMSAWYLFSAMGFYPFNPCGGEYIIGAPQVACAKLKVKGGEFKVVARNLSRENKYVKSVTLNGKPITDWKIRHSDIMRGGELVFEMTNASEHFGD